MNQFKELLKDIAFGVLVWAERSFLRANGWWEVPTSSDDWITGQRTDLWNAPEGYAKERAVGYHRRHAVNSQLFYTHQEREGIES